MIITTRIVVLRALLIRLVVVVSLNNVQVPQMLLPGGVGFQHSLPSIGLLLTVLPKQISRRQSANTIGGTAL